MPINQTANLLAYFNQNTPNASQITPVNSMTYPPIPAAITSFPMSNISDMSINSIISPFSTLPISGLQVLNSPATIGTFLPPAFATGVPGTMTYNNAYTDPNLPSVVVNPFPPTPAKIGTTVTNGTTVTTRSTGTIGNIKTIRKLFWLCSGY